MDVTGVVTPKQTHSDLFYDVRSADTLAALCAERESLIRFAECDALLCSDGMSVAGQRLAFAVATADCVPVIVRGRDSWAVIHAGWRGLANGIISRIVETMDEPCEAAIFAAAGGAVYEVGREVIDAIGPSAVVRGGGVKFLLDTAETAKNQLLSSIGADKIATSGLCTITDTRFHSYRRDGDSAGRSLTFIAP
jgi:YfiH family protein